MARTSSSGEAAGMIGPMEPGEFDMFDEFIDMGDGEQGSMRDSQDDDDAFNSFANDLHVLATADHFDKSFSFDSQVHGNNQATPYLSANSGPFINHNQASRLSVSPKDLNIDHNPDYKDAVYFQNAAQTGTLEDGNTTQDQSAMGTKNQEGKLASNQPETMVPQLSSESVRHPVHPTAGLEDVFTESNHVYAPPDNRTSFQKQLKVSQAATFNLQEPVLVSQAISYPQQSTPAPDDTLIDPKFRALHANDPFQPQTTEDGSPIGFSAHRREHASKAALVNSQASFAVVGHVVEDRGTKRQRVAFEENVSDLAERESMVTNQKRSLLGVPKRLVLLSDPADSQSGQIFGQTPHNKTRPKIMSNQQNVAPRFRGDIPTSATTNGPFAPQLLQGVESFPNQTIEPKLASFNPSHPFNPNRLLVGRESMPDGSSAQPGLPSPLSPSFSFPFDVFKYPTGKDFMNHLDKLDLKVIWDNLIRVMRNFPVKVLGRMAPYMLVDVAVYYLKSLTWDSPPQLTMIYFVTILRNSEKTDLHQWLWEVYMAACRIPILFPHRADVLGPLENIKSHIVRLSKIVLRHDMTCYRARDNPVFGKTISPAVWRRQHAGGSGWEALGVLKVLGNVSQWGDKFLEKSTAKFGEVGIDPRGDGKVVPFAEDAQGFL